MSISELTNQLSQIPRRTIQRDAAHILNLKSGVAVSCQLRKLSKTVEEAEELKSQLYEIAEKLELLQEKS